MSGFEHSSQLFLDVATMLPLLSLLFSVYQWVIMSRIWLHDKIGNRQLKIDGLEKVVQH